MHRLFWTSQHCEQIRFVIWGTIKQPAACSVISDPRYHCGCPLQNRTKVIPIPWSSSITILRQELHKAVKRLANESKAVPFHRTSRHQYGENAPRSCRSPDTAQRAECHSRSLGLFLFFSRLPELEYGLTCTDVDCSALTKRSCCNKAICGVFSLKRAVMPNTKHRKWSSCFSGLGHMYVGIFKNQSFQPAGKKQQKKCSHCRYFRTSTCNRTHSFHLPFIAVASGKKGCTNRRLAQEMTSNKRDKAKKKKTDFKYTQKKKRDFKKSSAWNEF